MIAVEQDQKIAAVLNKRLKKLNISNVEVMVADAVKTDFPYFNKVVSNLPYKISSPITFKLLEYDFDFAVLMYQLEFAERMVAKPGESNYSRLSLMRVSAGMLKCSLKFQNMHSSQTPRYHRL